MRIDVDGKAAFASTGGRAHDAKAPLVVFLHGAGMDRSVWSLQSRWFAHHGFRALAVDLPGHGGSEGPALTDIPALAAWTAALIGSSGGKARLVGHSMGALVALAAAARFPGAVEGIALVGVGARMPVHPDLLAAAKANHHDVIDMIALWGLGGAAVMGDSPAPGGWMLGAIVRLLERSAPGVIHADMAACDGYAETLADAAKVCCPTALVLGERDLMTPAKSGLALAAKIAGASVTVIEGAGHMMMVDKPDETLAALKAWARV